MVRAPSEQPAVSHHNIEGDFLDVDTEQLAEILVRLGAGGLAQAVIRSERQPLLGVLGTFRRRFFAFLAVDGGSVLVEVVGACIGRDHLRDAQAAGVAAELVDGWHEEALPTSYQV